MSGNEKQNAFNWKQLALWMGALIIGTVLGALNVTALNDFFNFIAGIYTRLFKFLAVPTIALAVTTTLALLGAKKNTGTRADTSDTAALASALSLLLSPVFFTVALVILTLEPFTSTAFSPPVVDL